MARPGWVRARGRAGPRGHSSGSHLPILRRQLRAMALPLVAFVVSTLVMMMEALPLPMSALLATETETSISVALTTVMLSRVIAGPPDPAKVTMAPGRKLVPMTTSVLLSPRVKALGDTELNVGAGPAMLVSAKVTPPPLTPVAVALPAVSVTAVVVLVPAKAPEAGGVPDAPAVKVTVTPLTGLPLASVTLATRGDPKAVPTVADCGLPLSTAIDLAAPAVLISWNAAGV